MGGATGHTHVAFCLAPRHPPVTPTNQHRARGRERERERARERERERKERAREDEWRRGFARERLGNRETLLGREEKTALRDLLVGVLSVPTLLSRRHLAHSPPSASTQTPSPTLWSFPTIARLPPRRYVCCDNTPRAPPSLFPTPSTTSRSRCRCRVERTWLARTFVAGWLRMGWWVLVHGRMGVRKAVVHHPLIHAPIARTAARETIAPPITQEPHVASTVYPSISPTQLASPPRVYLHTRNQHTRCAFLFAALD